MSTFNAAAAAQSAKALAVQLRAVLEVGEVLEQIGSLENATAEVQRQHAQAVAIATKQTEVLERQRGEIKQAQELHADVLRSCDLKRQEAALDAARIVKDAEDEAEEIRAGAAVELESSRAAKAALEREVADVAGQLFAKQTELQELEVQVERVRKAAAAIAGG